MTFLVRTLLVCLLLRVGASAAGLMTLADECRVPVIDGWVVLSDSGGYPIEFLHQSYDADLSIFKSSFSPADAVTTIDELRYAVDGVLEQVIDELPNSRLFTNIGFYHTNSAGFVLEFESSDSDGESSVRHRMYTVLYTLSDGAQVMFTLWAKATATDYTLAEPSIRYMQEHFAYFGEHREHVFPNPTSTRWRWVALLLGIVTIVWLIRRQRMHRAGTRPDA